MPGEEDTEKSAAKLVERVWELVEKIDICMFTTWDGETLRTRPLSARPDRSAHAIYFLVDESGQKNWQVKDFPLVSLGFADNSGHKYVALTGEASIRNDRTKIEELWTNFDKAWWDSEKDPAIRLLTVRPQDAELWDSPNKLVASAKMLAAAITGAKPRYGDNAKLDRI